MNTLEVEAETHALVQSIASDSHDLLNLSYSGDFGALWQDVTLVELTLQVRTARQQLALIERALEDATVKAMESDRLAIDGRWIAERRYSRDRSKWDNDALIHEVVKKAIVESSIDRETGEIIEPNATTWAVRDALVATARPSWRVTAVRELGIDPDEFCESVKGRTTVNILASKEAN